MECRVGAFLPHDAARQFVSSLANRTTEALRRECRMVEQCATDLQNLAAVESYDGAVCVFERRD